MKLKPLHDWVVIERDPAKTKENGFFIPSSPSNKGRIVAIGPKVQGIDVGDRVQFNAYAGLVIKAADRTATMLRPVDIVGVFLGRV